MVVVGPDYVWRCIFSVFHTVLSSYLRYLQDSPLGVRFSDFASAFPTGINTAASFNRRLMRTRGLFMGREHRGKGVNVALGPMMNMGRVADGGRNWEGFGADPYLTGEAAYETILGMQQGGVMACAKHLIGKSVWFPLQYL
jgi:beta-glucosidase-like glycosyl hydrolase